MARRGWLGVSVVVVLAVLAWLAWREPEQVVGAPRGEATDVPATTPSARPEVPLRAAPRAPVDAGVLDVFVTADGAPVLDALVSAARMVPSSSPWRPEWEPVVSAKSDGAGRAELSAEAGSWLVTVAKAGFATATLDVPRPTGEHRTRVEVRLSRGVELRGRAVDAAGHGVAPALVRLTPLGERSSRRTNAPLGVREVTVEPDGTFRLAGLAAGAWRIEGEAEGVGRAGPVEVSLPTTELVTLRFRASGFLEGVVVFGDGGVAASAQVSVSGEGVFTTLEAGPGGAFSLERQPGAYKVSARAGELVGAVDGVVPVRSGATTAARVVLSGHGGVLRGTVKRDDGSVVEGARLVLSPHNDDGLIAETTSGVDGRWRLEGLARGSYDLEAEATGLEHGAERGFFVDDGADHEVELVLARNGRVTGEVVDGRGAPLSMRVRLGARASGFANRFALAGADGRFTFDDVPAGAMYVLAERAPNEQSRSVDVKVPAGGTAEAKLVFPDLVALDVELDRSTCKSSGDTMLRAGEPGMMRRRVEARATPDEKKVTLLLAPGDWQLVGWVGGSDVACIGATGSHRVSVESGKMRAPVRFKFASLEDPLRVSVVERTGEPAPSATVVLRGDSLLHMQGTDLDGHAELEVPAEGTFVLAASKQGRSASTPVTRAKKAVTLTLEPAARIHLRIDNGTGLSRIVTSTEHQEMMDELRATGAEAWLEEVSAGLITVTVTSADGTRVGRVQVTTTAGQVSEARVDLSLPARVKGRVTLPSPTRAFVVLESAQGTEGVPVEADGSFEFRSLVAGEWSASVNCRGCGFASKRFTVAAGATVELNFP